MLTSWTDVLLETLIIFLLIFLKAHLLFEYPGIWLPSLFLELCLCVKQAGGLTCKSAQGGDWSWPRLIYQWIICSASKPLKCAVVTTDFPKGIAPRIDCLHDREKRRGKARRQRGEDKKIEWWGGRERCTERERRGGEKVLMVRRRENGVPNSITEWVGLLPCGCGMWSHQYFDFSFGNSCVSLFQRYFFLIYRIPQERSISWPWHRLPPLNLGPDRPSSDTHIYTLTHTHAHLLPKSRH